MLFADSAGWVVDALVAPVLTGVAVGLALRSAVVGQFDPPKDQR